MASFNFDSLADPTESSAKKKDTAPAKSSFNFDSLADDAAPVVQAQKSPKTTRSQSNPPLTGAANKLVEAVAGAEMGGALRLLPGLTKLAYPAAQALQAGINTAKSYSSGHRLEHWGDIAKGAAAGAFNPRETAVNALAQTVSGGINPESDYGDAAATLGGMLASTNAGAGGLAKIITQAPVAAGAAYLGSKLEQAGEGLVDKFIDSPQLNAAAKGAVEAFGVPGVTGGTAHLTGKLLGAGFNRGPDAIKDKLGEGAIPNSQEVAHAKELTSLLNTPEGKQVLSKEAEVNAPAIDIPPGTKLDNQWKAKQIEQAEKQTHDAVKTAEDMAGLAFKKEKDMVGSDLIKIPSSKIKEHFDITAIKDIEKELANAQKDASQIGDPEQNAQVLALKKVYDVANQLFFRPALSPKKVNDDVHFDYNMYKDYINQANALENSINIKGMAPKAVQQMKNLKRLAKDAFATHLKEKEFNGTPEEQNRYAGATEFHPRKDVLWGQTQEVKNRTPFLKEIQSTQAADQARKSNFQNATEEHLQSGLPSAGVEHITRAMQDLLPFLPEGAPHVAKNMQATPDIFNKALQLAVENKKSDNFLLSHHKEKEFLRRKELDAPDVINYDAAENLAQGVEGLSTKLNKRAKQLDASNMDNPLLRQLLMKGTVPKIVRGMRLGLGRDLTPAKAAAVDTAEQNIRSASGRRNLKSELDNAVDVQRRQKQYGRDDLKSAIAAGAIGSSLAATSKKAPSSTDNADEKSRLRRQKIAMEEARIRGRAFNR